MRLTWYISQPPFVPLYIIIAAFGSSEAAGELKLDDTRSRILENAGKFLQKFIDEQRSEHALLIAKKCVGHESVAGLPDSERLCATGLDRAPVHATGLSFSRRMCSAMRHCFSSYYTGLSVVWFHFV